MKILALTSIRSDYDLLSPLYKKLNSDPEIEFKVLVSGAHLSENYGYTKQYIADDGFDILMELETLIDSDSLKSKLKTASLFLQNSIDVVAQFSPDVIIYAGDREDVIMGGLLGVYLRVPTIHFYGGDHEIAGHEDTVIRHATSKLSSLHFVSTEEHKLRLLKMGENTNRVYNIGSVALDKFCDFSFIEKNKIFEKLGLSKKSDEFSLVIYHPSPDTQESDPEVFRNILTSLKRNNIFSFVSYPNTDANSVDIVNVIRDFERSADCFYFFKNLERDIFLSIFSNSSFIIGNSSAGLLEAASIPIPAINVGARQTGRLCNDNVKFIGTSIDEIDRGIEFVRDKEFTLSLRNMSNIFGDGKSSERAYQLIKSIGLDEWVNKTEDPLCM